jgi:uncharacterized protein (DUF2384 family)
MATLIRTSPARKLEAAATRKLVQWTRSTLGFTYREVGVLFGATPRTAQRWTDPKTHAMPSPTHRVRLDEVRELRRLLEQVFATPKDAQVWLRRAVPLLQGRRPIDLIQRGHVDEVNRVLAGLYSGTFA